MQISKTILLLCAAGFCAALLPLRAADADLQNKLQEALDKKLNELQAQPPAAVPAPAAVAPKPRRKPAPTPTPASAPVAKPAPAPAAQAESSSTLVMPPAVEPALIEKAREALRQKMTEMNASPASQPAPAAKPAPAPAPVVAPAAPAQPPPAVAQPAPAPTPAPTPVPAPQPAPAAVPAAPAVQATPPTIVAPPPVSPESIEKAREALHQKMKELEGQQPAPTTAPAPAATPAPAMAKPAAAMPQPTVSKPVVKPPVEAARKKPAKGALSFPPIPAPPPAVSVAKEQRLDDLLRRYKADEITPEEYHEQRAKILAGP